MMSFLVIFMLVFGTLILLPSMSFDLDDESFCMTGSEMLVL